MNTVKLIKLERLPQNVDELRELADLSDPFNTAALAVAAFNVYEKDPDTAVEMVNFLKGPSPLSNYDLQFIRDRIRYKGYVIRSYFKGTSPENDYTIGEAPYEIQVSDNPYSYTNEGYAVLYLHSSGSDNDRPITLRRKGDGQWLLWEHTFLSDIRQPKSQDPWA